MNPTTKHGQRIGIIGAMEAEVALLRDSLNGLKTHRFGKNFVVYTGQFAGKDIALCQSGIGKVNAAIATTLLAYAERSASFATVLCHLWLMGMAWNAVDLLLVDWLLICTLASPLFIFPNTAHYAGRRDFRFHFVGFLKGCVAMSAVSGVLAVLTFGLMHLTQ